MNIQDVVHVIALLPNEFSSHQLIEKYIRELEADYIDRLNPENGSMRKLHGEIGRFLMNNSNRLGIEKIGISMDKNIKGYDSPNALWRKVEYSRPNNIGISIMFIILVLMMSHSLYGESLHKEYNPNQKMVIISKTVIDTIKANLIFKEKYEPIILEKYKKGIEKKEKIDSLYLNTPSKVKTPEEKKLLQQAYMTYSKAYLPELATKFRVPLPKPIIIPFHTRVKMYTKDGIELTDRNLKKGKITKEVKEYLKYYSIFLEDSLKDEQSRIKLGWCEWLKKEEIPYKIIQESILNPNYRGLNYNRSSVLDESEYAGLIRGWEFLDSSTGTFRKDTYPQEINYLVYNEIPTYKVFGKTNSVRKVYDNNGNLKYISGLNRSISIEELEDIKRIVYLEDYKNNKHNIKSQSHKTLQFLEKSLSTPNEVTNIKYKKRNLLLKSAMVMDSYIKVAAFNPVLSENYAKVLKSSDKMKKMQEEAKKIDVVGLRYIEQLEEDHKNDFEYVYQIDRLSDTSFRVVYLNAQTLTPSYCAVVLYYTGDKPYTTKFSTKLVPMPSDIPTVIIK